MNERTAARIAWSCVGITALLGAGTVVLIARSGPSTGVFQVQSGPTSAVTDALIGLGFLVYPTVGAVIVSRRPDHILGWLFCAIGVIFSLANFSGTYAYHALDANPGSLPFGAAVEVLFADGLWIPTITISTIFLALFFPSGHLHSRGERRIAWIAGVAAVICGPLGSITERSIYPAPQIRNPLPTRIPSAVLFNILVPIGLLVLVGCIVFSVVLLIKRFRRSGGEERQQYKWFLFSGACVVITLIPSSVFDTPPVLLEAATLIALLALPVAVAIAILKYRLFDIDVVIRKTVVFAMLAGSLVVIGAVVLLVVGGIAVGPVADNRVALLVAGVLIGVAILPLRKAATRMADRVVFGGRRTPYEILTSFAGRVGETYSSDDVLTRMAQVLATGTGATMAAVWLGEGGSSHAAAVWPVGAAAPASLPSDAIEVRHQGDTIGALSVEMPPNDPMSPAKERLIQDLASQAGPVLRNVRLLDELRESRRRIVTAQDERARKLERDIHDGAQQQLIALQVQLKLARSMLERDPLKASEMLEGLSSNANEALENLRDLARGIYPPLLADKGLAAALEAQGRKSPLLVTVSCDGIGRFPQDVEAAVYFSCLEGLQNVAKYAEAKRARIDLRTDGNALLFEIADDGKGFDPSRTRYGTGLQGIADRLSALGGELTVSSSAGGGTSLSGRLPLPDWKPVEPAGI